VTQWEPLGIVLVQRANSHNVEPVNHNPILKDWIVTQILQSPDRRISFADYMNWVLYHPTQGYYASSAARIGALGDFVTSPHLGCDFAELLAEQWVECWQLLHQPQPFSIVEMGAGQGLVAADSLNYLQKNYPACFAAVDYVILERAAAQRQAQQAYIQERRVSDRVRWSNLADLPSESICGCFFSNELVDALPVHQVTLLDGQLQEVYVTYDARLDQLVEQVGDLSTPLLADYFVRVGIDLMSGAYPNGYRTEVNLAALEWLAQIADRLQQGYVITIDYGYLSDRYYNPMRSQGTLQCYIQQQHHSDPYYAIGQQDITAHADFTALQRQGDQCELQTLGLTRQGLFLMGLGIGDRIVALSQRPVSTGADLLAILRRREALQALVSPTGLGNFYVLVQGKNILTSAGLRGLAAEWLPGL